ncbi:MAG: hypothetical protein SFV17_10520 [Candidatus Obscuribacter sp.]|nr:hypothetical protein [Candidatus Melainabacteria bacterium]MDX1987106.1 hypothetical protein [Candidatus Obscuribacter sp.]
MNKQNPDSEKIESNSSEDRKVPSKDLSRADIDMSNEVLEAANSPAKLFDAVEAARTNKHSGSAGGDQAYSIEIVMDDGNRVSRLDPLTAGGPSIKGSISREELEAKAAGGDGFAASYLKQMEACDWLSENARSIRLNEIQKQADLTYGRKTTLLIGSVSSSESGLPEGSLEFLDEQMVPSDELAERLASFKSARNELVQSVIDLGYEKEKIDGLCIADDDVGSALALYLLGPDLFERFGKSQSRDLGNNLLIFGIAPLFGACETAAQKWEREKPALGVEGSVNFFFGTVVGAALERLHPAVAGGLIIVALPAMVHDAFLSDEALQRNSNLSVLASHAGGLDSLSILKYSQYTKGAVGPVLFKQAFDFATSGFGVPPGSSLSRVARQEALDAGETAVRLPFSNVEVDSLIDRFWHMPLGVMRDIWNLIPTARPTLAFESATNRVFPSEQFKPIEQLFSLMASFEEQFMKSGESQLGYYERIAREFPKALMNKRESVDVVKQFHKNACVCAVGEMAMEGKVSQQELWKMYQESLPFGMSSRESKVPLRELPKLMNNGWRSGYSSPEQFDQFISAHSGWVAEIKLLGHDAHVVFVDGFDSTGNLRIRDPGEGVRYEMSVRDFVQYWNGNYVCK